MKFFWCAKCQREKPITKKVTRGHKTCCTDCMAGVSKFQRPAGHKQDTWAPDPLPDYILDRYQESVAD